MKTKVLLLMVLLIGITCLVVYGRIRPPSYEEQRRMQKQRFEQEQEYQRQIQSRRQSRSNERKQRQEGVSSNRLTQLEVRVANLEHALITQLTHRAMVSPSLKSVLDNETILRSRTGKAEVERVVHTRIAKTVESRAARELKQ